ncbi:MAG TPA: S1/P1 nuclease [Chthoniobacterales bacterium]|nr:S1/P1 nuclease [Chthoniobacterales bacterium]
MTIPRTLSVSFSALRGFVFVAFFAVNVALAYGPVGHEIVGAVADEKLARSAAGEKINALLDGLPLEKVATYPDEIRGWDKNGPDDPNTVHFSNHPKIDAALRDYWHANPPTKDLNSATPSHHWFHYTDVPVLGGEKYGDGKVGRSKWDIVHMIPYCISVLKGEVPEDNPRKITKPMAVILITHFVGDIHQPLHVGAEFFDKEGHPANPDKTVDTIEDQGGNTLTLNLTSGGTEATRHAKFHSFWDSESVMANLPPMPESISKEEKHARIEAAKKELVKEFVTNEPKAWRQPSDVALKDYAEAWANEIMPMAREAHERLQFRDVAAKQMEDGTVAAAGFLDEKKSADGVSYYDWAARSAREQLRKAGWRLADVLEQALR